MLDIFFNNKIPSSKYEWTDELIRVATIFNDFNGQKYDRALIVERFEEISNRVADARDAADYRDEYGAYPGFLGVASYEQSASGWTCRVSRQVQELLCSSLPDPRSYVRLQMALLQYPNPIGAAFRENGTLTIEPRAQAKRVAQVQGGVKTVPFRLFLRVLLALHDEHGPTEARLSYPEIWHCLFRKQEAIGTFDPDGSALARNVMKFRARPLDGYNVNALRNLHILKHTGIISQAKSSTILRLAPGAGDADLEIGRVARSIADMTTHFDIPGQSASQDEIRDWARQCSEDGSWASYYSGGELTSNSLEVLVASSAEIDSTLLTGAGLGPGAPLLNFGRERQARAKSMRRPASREETEALREKANLRHRVLVQLLAERLRAHDVTPESNVFVDLCCLAPKKMLFEAKSCRPENLLSQIRKGVSQLYEYRYRHDELNGAKLVLALESRPEGSLDWLLDYLVDDREIAVCWLEGEDNLTCPSWCQDCLGPIVNRIEQMP